MTPLLAFLDWHAFYFMLFALVACLFGLAVLFSSNIVRMAFYLVISLGATSGLFFLAGAEFVGAMQLLIYVGGTLVLLIFGVMLTAKDAFVTMKTRPAEWVMAAIVGGGLLTLLLYAAFNVPQWRGEEGWAEERAKIGPHETEDTALIGLALVGERADKLNVESEIEISREFLNSAEALLEQRESLEQARGGIAAAREAVAENDYEAARQRLEETEAPLESLAASLAAAESLLERTAGYSYTLRMNQSRETLEDVADLIRGDLSAASESHDAVGGVLAADLAQAALDPVPGLIEGGDAQAAQDALDEAESALAGAEAFAGIRSRLRSASQELKSGNGKQAGDIVRSADGALSRTLAGEVTSLAESPVALPARPAEGELDDRIARLNAELRGREELLPGLSGYLLPFEIISVHLLVVLIGAGYLARTKRRRTAAVARTDAAAPATKSRSGLVAAVVVPLFIINVVLAIVGAVDVFSGTRNLLAAVRAVYLGLIGGLEPPAAILAGIEDGFNSWLYPVMVVAWAAAASCLAAIFLWKRWGFFGLAVTGIAQPTVVFIWTVMYLNATGQPTEGGDFADLLARAGLALLVAGSCLIANLLGLAAVYFALQLPRGNSAWRQLE